MGRYVAVALLVSMSGLVDTGCKSAPTPVVVAPPPPPVAADTKLAWISRLEHQRVLRDEQASPAPDVGASVARANVFVSASAPSLDRLALDLDPVIRRRAVLAIGRVGTVDGVPPLVFALEDPDGDVRATAAFALGLIGPDAGDAVSRLEAALQDPSSLVRGRAIEALGLIGNIGAAAPIARVSSGCPALLAPIAPDDEEAPKPPPIEACRLALFALVRLRQYESLAEIAVGGDGRPVSQWWPVAYALARISDPRATPALLALALTPGVDTAGFALRGLATLKDPAAVPIAKSIAANTQADIKVRIAAVRTLGQVGGPAAVQPLLELLSAPGVPHNLTVEVVNAIGASGYREAFDPLLDRIADPSPTIRSAVLAAVARVKPDSFLYVLSGLGRDPDWSVRAALAGVLAPLPADRVTSAIEDLTADEDARVHSPALEALAAVKAPDLAARLFAALEAPDFAERSTAARLLGEARPDGGVARLIAAYERGQSDQTYSARAAALEALSKYATDEARATIRQGLTDRDWPVRWRAAKLLNALGDPAALPHVPAPLRQPVEFFDGESFLHPAFSPHAFIETGRGNVEVELNVVDAPITTHNFIELARAGFFNGVKVHRLVPTFVIQAGDPRGDGEGGPGYAIADELSPLPYVRGTMGMALDWRDTGGSQWFITLSPQPHLDAKYTVFGRVVNGWDVLDRVAQWDVIDRVRIWDGVDFK